MTKTLDATPGAALRHLPGNFYFADLHTTDIDAAASFYSRLFGWNIGDIPGTPIRYLPADVDGRSKAAITGLSEDEQAASARPYWRSYLYVRDVDATVARTLELGGSVRYEAVDVFDFGRMAVIVDPTGAEVGLWHDRDPNETSVLDEHGSPFWRELHTSDIDAALDFYEGLVGWTRQANEMGPDMTYYVMETPGADHMWQRSTAGMMQQMEHDAEAGVPSNWAVYVNVDDVDASTELARELGAEIVMGPQDIPGVGRMTWLADPQGAHLAMMTPNPMQAD